MLNTKDIINAFLSDFKPIITSIEDSAKKIQKAEQESVISEIDAQLQRAYSLLRQLSNFQKTNTLLSLTENTPNFEQPIPTGFKSLNKPLAGGYFKGDIISVWSTPFMGMTAFLLSSAYYIASKGIRVLYITEQDAKNWTAPRLKASLDKLNFETENISLYFETVYRFETDTLKNLCKTYKSDVVIIDIKPNIQVYHVDFIHHLKDFALEQSCCIIFNMTLGLSHIDMPLKIEELWNREIDKAIFDSSDVVLTLYRKIWSLENMPPEKTGNAKEDMRNAIHWQEEVDYYKHRIDIECFKNVHGESFWKRHFYYDDCAFVLDKIPVRKYDDTI